MSITKRFGSNPVPLGMANMLANLCRDILQISQHGNCWVFPDQFIQVQHQKKSRLSNFTQNSPLALVFWGTFPFRGIWSHPSTLGACWSLLACRLPPRWWWMYCQDFEATFSLAVWDQRSHSCSWKMGAPDWVDIFPIVLWGMFQPAMWSFTSG